MTRFYLLFLSLFVIVMMLDSCYYDTEEELYNTVICDTTDISYTTKIAGIISESCFPCHDNATQEFGISLEGYANLKEETQNGSVLCAIRHENGCYPMPKDGGQLDQCTITLIELWAASNFPEN